MNDFASHNQTVQPLKLPRPTVTEILHLNPVLISRDREKIDDFADEMLRQERERERKQDSK